MMLLQALAAATYDPEKVTVVCDVPEKEQEKIKEELAQAAEAFLRAGGVLTSNDWLAMSPYEKAAMIYAGNALRDETAIKIGRCVFDEQYRAALESTYDDGKMLKKQNYNEALGELQEQMKRVSEDMRKHVYVAK